MFFEPPYTKDSIRKQYKLLAKQLHPDRGGDTQKFQQMKKQYDELNKFIDELPTKKERKKKLKVKTAKRAKVNVYHIHININKMMDAKNILNDFINSIFR
ncbi:J domain-containing protein [Flavobacterium sp.]|uniref:J domain-containing protein n=1 Tax=Flavobacterium sp. TaxID=239 RepID=UPI002B4B77C5|nr:J domain-containing protein [Flavobacterium sp.]HLF52334.1 J domain-containing protein [Flavobacterium sp.]